MKEERERKRVIKHHSREERRRRRGERKGEGIGRSRRERKKGGEVRKREHRRKWTVNRSPHGNKTARDQRGREEWKVGRVVGRREGKEREKSLKERRNRKGYVTQTVRKRE